MNPLLLNKFIGIPFKKGGSSFKGCDCNGLVTLYFNELCKKKHKFKEIEIQEPYKDNDVLLFIIPQQSDKESITMHCGIYINNKLLHTIKNTNSVLQNLNTIYFIQYINKKYRLI